MTVCTSEAALQFVRLLPQRDLLLLRKNPCYQQVKMEAKRLREQLFVKKLRVLFELYIMYLLRSRGNRDMKRIERLLGKVEEDLGLKGKLRPIYRPLVETYLDSEDELRALRQEFRRSRKEDRCLSSDDSQIRKKGRKRKCPTAM